MTARSGFVEQLVKLKERGDRAALAALRRGLGKPPGTVAEMYRYVEPFLEGTTGRERADAHYLVAALYASHPEHGDGIEEGNAWARNLGASFARLRDQSESIEKRFMALLNCRRAELPEHLRHAVSLLRANDVAIDYDQLLRDIQWWESEDRSVQRRWARAFWRTRPSEQEPAARATDEDTA